MSKINDDLSLVSNRGSMFDDVARQSVRLRKVYEGCLKASVRVPPTSATVLLSRSTESPTRAQIFGERKKVFAAFVHSTEHTVNQPELHLATANLKKTRFILTVYTFTCFLGGEADHLSFEIYKK